MKKLLILLCLLAVVGCKKEKVFTAMNLQKLYKQNQKSDFKIVIPPPSTKAGYYYCQKNFLIDNDGKFYFYQLNSPELSSCFGGGNEDLRATFINLKPENLKEIPENEFLEFALKKNSPKYGKAYMWIASTRDTFTSPELSKLMKHIENDKETDWRAMIRTTTEEEEKVLQYKKSGKAYNAAKIEWDTTKTKMIKNQ
jgi:hypothetical protein